MRAALSSDRPSLSSCRDRSPSPGPFILESCVCRISIEHRLRLFKIELGYWRSRVFGPVAASFHPSRRTVGRCWRVSDDQFERLARRHDEPTTSCGLGDVMIGAGLDGNVPYIKCGIINAPIMNPASAYTATSTKLGVTPACDTSLMQPSAGNSQIS